MKYLCYSFISFKVPSHKFIIIYATLVTFSYPKLYHGRRYSGDTIPNFLFFINFIQQARTHFLQEYEASGTISCQFAEHSRRSYSASQSYKYWILEKQPNGSNINVYLSKFFFAQDRIFQVLWESWTNDCPNSVNLIPSIIRPGIF